MMISVSQRRQVDAREIRREIGIGIRADAIEGDEAQVEQARVADDDIQAERQHSHQRDVPGDADHEGRCSSAAAA